MAHGNAAYALEASRALAAKELGVHPDTLRRWEVEGRIEAPERTAGGRRRYDLAKLHNLFVLITARPIEPGREYGHDLNDIIYKIFFKGRVLASVDDDYLNAEMLTEVTSRRRYGGASRTKTRGIMPTPA